MEAPVAAATTTAHTKDPATSPQRGKSHVTARRRIADPSLCLMGCAPAFWPFCICWRSDEALRKSRRNTVKPRDSPLSA